MEDRDTSQDTTVRGREINVPHSTAPNRTTRHQPNTPIPKQKSATKPLKEQTKPPAAAPPVPPEPEPETDSEE